MTVLNRVPTPAERVALDLLAHAGYVTEYAVGWHLLKLNPERPYNTERELRSWGGRVLRQLEEAGVIRDAGPHSRQHGKKYVRNGTKS